MTISLKDRRLAINAKEYAKGILDIPLQELAETYSKLLELLVSNVILLSTYDDETKDYSDTMLFVAATCSDTFAYACSDCEGLKTYRDLDEVYEIYKFYGHFGVVAWIAERRKMEPIIYRGFDMKTTEKYKAAKSLIENMRKKSNAVDSE